VRTLKNYLYMYMVLIILDTLQHTLLYYELLMFNLSAHVNTLVAIPVVDLLVSNYRNAAEVVHWTLYLGNSNFFFSFFFDNRKNRHKLMLLYIRLVQLLFSRQKILGNVNCEVFIQNNLHNILCFYCKLLILHYYI
jgi:hypothetical protein